MINIRNATLDDIPLINSLARIAWPATYSNMLSKEQLNYMFEMMYSLDSLKIQMTEKKHNYFILFDDDTPHGYISIHIVDGEILYLEKIYVLPESQGKGYGELLLKKAEEFALSHSLYKIRLNMNRENKSRYFYEHLGFKIIGERDFHIGQGFYMNDYILEKSLLEKES
ncbi:MAG: GNAT family N-acetyltransferase [Prevotellaceae bacterium]|jgi:GNAT superfamily N-acetyltransferase|nr:GNAT family N-acetyltransferase [Prevotellaceae bacterium]